MRRRPLISIFIRLTNTNLYSDNPDLRTSSSLAQLRYLAEQLSHCLQFDQSCQLSAVAHCSETSKVRFVHAQQHLLRATLTRPNSALHIAFPLKCSLGADKVDSANWSSQHVLKFGQSSWTHNRTSEITEVSGLRMPLQRLGIAGLTDNPDSIAHSSKSVPRGRSAAPLLLRTYQTCAEFAAGQLPCVFRVRATSTRGLVDRP